MIRVAILHYHLRRGGVTSVIKSVAQALNGREVELLVISGEDSPEENFPLPVEVVPELNYRATGDPADAEFLKEALIRGACKGFGGVLPDVWHVHNHSLAKNVAFPAALTLLAQENDIRLLAQFHDFSEDSRPANYAAMLEYEKALPITRGGHLPSLPNVLYTALNQRDLGYLRSSGIPESNLAALPNPVSPPTVELPSPSDRPFEQEKKFVLYPTRAIRRKNLGELVLLAALYRETHHFATTLIPENEQWLTYHQHWERVIEDLSLPVTLGIGNDYDFFDLLGWSDSLITTSVAEGFGLAFLEPWLLDKPLIGRDLPEITLDFGLDLGSLYSELPIPSAWIDLELLKSKVETALTDAYESYHRPVPENAVENAMNSLVTSTGIDFGRLDEALQTTAIKAALKSNYHPEGLLDSPAPETTTSNREICEQGFNLDAYATELIGLYQRLQSNDLPGSAVDPDVFLDQFLEPSRINLLRTS